MIIEIENVQKTYRTNGIEQPALRGVNLTVEKGDFLVLAGPSGSGKTTLLNLMGTLDDPTEGTVRFEGNDLRGLSDDVKSDLRLRSIGFVFQAYNLVNVLSAQENVEYVLQLQGLDPRDRAGNARTLLKAVGLEGYESRRPEQLSGGQQQRVAVARALASNPSLILADEPTANLDQATGRELIGLMLALNRDQGHTFVISSHDEMVIEQARRLVKLVDGRIVSDERR